MQPLPDLGYLPVKQAAPAVRATATIQFLRQQTPRAARAPDEDDATEGSKIRDSRATAFGFGRLLALVEARWLPRGRLGQGMTRSWPAIMPPRRGFETRSRYGTIENVVAIEDAGIRAYIPLSDFEHRTAFYGRDAFTYDPERDEYRCPEGQPLLRHRAKRTEEAVFYRGDAATCNACSLNSVH